MQDVPALEPRTATNDSDPSPLERLQHAIEHAAHLLPSQGPITVFVHHNTLHPFEDLPFDEAVRKGAHVYNCQPYMPESHYRQCLSRDRIRQEDLTEVLMEDLGDNADRVVGGLISVFRLRHTMLMDELGQGTEAELRWLMAETDALRKFRDETSPHIKDRLIAETRHEVLRDYLHAANGFDRRLRDVSSSLIDRFGAATINNWSDDTWEAFTLNVLWRICREGVHGLPADAHPAATASHRHQALLYQATGIDIDLYVHPVLIRYSAAFLDQGYANWPLPNRNDGYFKSFLKLYGEGSLVSRWYERLPRELRRIEQAGMTPLESIDESLRLLGVSRSEQEEFVTESLLALRGWAGMIWQMETNAEWTLHPAPAETLLGFLAVRLILERVVLERVAKVVFGKAGELSDLRKRLHRQIRHQPRISVDQRAFQVYQLAQLQAWSPIVLLQKSKQDWKELVREIEEFTEFERRRIYHLAFERHYRNQILDAVINHAHRGVGEIAAERSFQLVTCIDDREESFRRHLEEIDPQCETFGAPGFFAVPMYYRGASDAHYRPLCPVIIKPKHYVREEVAYSLRASSRQRAQTRRMLGAASHRWHVGSRSLLGGIVTAFLGSVASIALVARILFPRLTAQLRRIFGNLIQPPAVTELRLYRAADPPGPDDEHLGYTVDEMVNCVERVLRDIGLVHNFSKLVFLVGHGSASLNNPHESAYGCGACSGGRGGPNARAYAQMANDPRVREVLKARGLEIPADTHFIGALHNTCDEDVTFFDLDNLPVSHRKLFEVARDVIDQARERNAHERCRRFESADLQLSPAEALEHVEGRAEDLSQARPEYNHATNALCFVGRREWSRGLFLDRRAFLQSYDPALDDTEHTILARILQPAVPVCAGISLEYYFSSVDVLGYGCGSKLPHNITSMLGVMEGAASDLRTGLSQQMIEIHEPVRILFLVESTPQALLSILDRNAEIGRMVRNDWIQLATFDAATNTVMVYSHGRFERYQPTSTVLPQAKSSMDWYRGWRDHLGCASIVQDHLSSSREGSSLVGSAADRSSPSSLRQGSGR